MILLWISSDLDVSSWWLYNCICMWAHMWFTWRCVCDFTCKSRMLSGPVCQSVNYLIHPKFFKQVFWKYFYKKIKVTKVSPALSSHQRTNITRKFKDSNTLIKSKFKIPKFAVYFLSLSLPISFYISIIYFATNVWVLVSNPLLTFIKVLPSNPNPRIKGKVACSPVWE